MTPKVEPQSTAQTCPHCGYCPHCGRSNPVGVRPWPQPYPVPYPVYPRPWGTWISQPTTITYGTNVAGRPEDFALNAVSN